MFTTGCKSCGLIRFNSKAPSTYEIKLLVSAVSDAYIPATHFPFSFCNSLLHFQLRYFLV